MQAMFYASSTPTNTPNGEWSASKQLHSALPKLLEIRIVPLS